MRLDPNDTIVRRFVALNAVWRTRIFSVTFDECPKTGRIRQVADNHFEADVMDLSSRRFYATARGKTEREAIVRALELAERSPKPLSAAQQADVAAGRAAFVDPATLDAARRETDALKARIAELEAQVGKRGKAPKPEKPTEKDAA